MDIKDKTIAFIPLRGGSKSIPLKNIKLMAEKPLAYWTIKAAIDCSDIDEVVVSTDSEYIKTSLEFIKSDKLTFFDRSATTSTDTASTESAMIEYFQKNKCALVVLIQATSPLTTSEDLKKSFEIFREGKYDSLLSLVKLKRFFWQKNQETVEPLNYNYQSRPRRQDFEGILVENGAFYITRHDLLLGSQCRLNGKIGHYEMNEDTFFEIDEPSDWLIVEGLLKKQHPITRYKNLKNIKVLATDIDGCLTDAGMYYSENGDELKKFNTKDGMGLNLLQKAGIKVGVITAEDRELNRRRAKKLNLDFEYHGSKFKIDALKDLCKRFNVLEEEVAYIGDDINDIEILKAVGFSACPADAISEVKDIVDYQSSLNGGSGVIRNFSSLYFSQLKETV